MTKRELIREISEVSGISQEDLKRGFDATLSVFLNALLRGEKIVLRGLGTYSVKILNSRNYFNPKTRQNSVTEEKKTIQFTVHDSLKKRLNE